MIIIDSRSYQVHPRMSKDVVCTWKVCGRVKGSPCILHRLSMRIMVLHTSFLLWILSIAIIAVGRTISSEDRIRPPDSAEVLRNGSTK